MLPLSINVSFIVCSAHRKLEDERCNLLIGPSVWVQNIQAGFLIVWFVQRLVTMEIYTNKHDFQSRRMRDTQNPRGLQTLHSAARQRAKEDGCREGSQHWFLQAKPLARGDARSFASCWCVSSLLDVHFKLSIIPLKGKQRQHGVEACLEQS